MFKNSFVALVLLAGQAWAAVSFTSVPASVAAGTTVNLGFTATGTGPITILLRQGDPANLQTLATITSSATGSSFAWTVPSTLASASNYAFQIIQGADTNYAGPFAVTGGAAANSVAASAAASGAASAPASAAASASASSYPSMLPSVIRNGTIPSNSTSTVKSSASSTGAAKASATIVSANSAVAIGSPLALVLSAVAAMLYWQ